MESRHSRRYNTGERGVCTMIGVIIDHGPADWQILQQNNGTAVVNISGHLILPAECQIVVPAVSLRIVREDSGMDVLPWQEAQLEENGCWKMQLCIPTGGLYRLESCAHEKGANALEWALRGDMRYHLGVGDLYVIAGQSNSAGYGKDPFYDPPELGVHLFRNSMRWDLAAHPMNDSTDTVHPVNQEGANPGASPYLTFAKTLHRELGYPIGLLQTSLGGSPLSRWNPEENGDLYRSMIEVIRSQGGSIRGILWYQGCSDTGPQECNSYEQRFARVVEQLRTETGEETPWLTIQLNRQLLWAEGESVDPGWGIIRDAQRRCARNIPRVSIVPAIDCGLSDGIHNSAAANVVLGERLAAAALRDIYGRTYGNAAPDLEKAEFDEEGNVVLHFSHVAGRLYAFDSCKIEQNAFSLWDENHNPVAIKQMELAGDRIILHPAESLGSCCTAAAGWQMEPPCDMPVDFASHLPILSFYDVRVCR